MSQDQFNESISEEKFWEKVVKIPRRAGCSVIRNAITLYVLLTESEVPIIAKSSISVALLYLLMPVDAVPDFLPGGLSMTLLS